MNYKSLVLYLTCLPTVEFVIWLNRNDFLLSHIIICLLSHLIWYILIFGGAHVTTPAGHKYFLTIVDDCTRATWVYLLCAKSDVLTIFPDFYTLIYNQYGTTIKFVRSDNAPELAFLDFFCSKGIVPYHSCVDTP